MSVRVRSATIQSALDYDLDGPLNDEPHWYDAINDVFVYAGPEPLVDGSLDLSCESQAASELLTA